MAKPRKAWQISPSKTPKPPLPDSIKAEVEAKATALIENVLKPRYVLPPPKDGQFNYIVDIGAKWYRNYFYFTSTYACPGPNALSPTFEMLSETDTPAAARFTSRLAKSNFV